MFNKFPRFFLMTLTAAATGLLATPSPTAAQPRTAEAPEPDTIVVRSQRESQSRAIEDKRNADTIQDVVSSDAIGQFPDKNVAESLQRLPGVSTTRDQGEGRFVIIRGLDAALNSVSVDGIGIGTPEGSQRSATLDVIPSDSTERLVVIKAPTPDLPGDSIGGSIRIESASAFDRGGRTLRGKAEFGYADLSEDTNQKLSLNYSDILDETFGVAFGVNYQDRDFESDNIEAEYDFNDDLGQDVLLAEQVQLRKYFINRERLGAHLNFDWRPDDSRRYHLRSLYSDFTDAETRQRSIFNFGDGTLAGIDAGGAYLIDEIPADELARRIRFRTKEQSTLALSLGGENRFGNAIADYGIGFTSTRERVGDEVEGRFDYAGSGDLSAVLDQTRGYPRYTITDPDGSAWLRNDNYEFNRVVLEPKAVDDDELSARFNLGFRAGNVQWKGGLLGRWRDRTSDVGESELRNVPDLMLSAWESGAPSHQLADIGPGVSSRAMRDYLRTNAGSILERPQDVEDNVILNAANDYEAEENIYAAYGMATVDFDALRLIAGLRVERTDFSATGNAIEFDAGGDLVLPLPARSVSSEYTSVLPGLHLRHDRGDDWVFRGAWTQTISRPSFSDISPRMELNNEDQEVELGNPELDPYKSNNLDFSAERYLGRSGLLAAGLFYKKIDGYIVETVSNNVADFPGFEVTRPVNGDDATVYGVELNWQQTLDRLPGLWSGVLVGLSATFLDTEFELPARAGETFSLPRASDRILSAHLGYEKHGLSTRLSVVQRNEYLDSIGDDLDFDLYVQKHTQMDFNLDYRVNSTLGLFFEASNLLDEPLELYQGSAGNVLQYELYGRTYAAGFKLKL